MNWIFPRFPDETMKIASACRLKFDNRLSEIGDAMVYHLIVNRIKALRLAIISTAKRIPYFQFHPQIETTSI
jgi:hypothetical protein